MGIKALEILQRDHLPEEAERKGRIILNMLREKQSKYPERIAEVRGKGLMIGAEIVKDLTTLAPDADAAHRIVQRLLESGVICLSSGPFGQTLSITPPLIISDDEVATLCEILSDVIDEVLG